MQQLFYLAFFVILVYIVVRAVLRGSQVSGLRQVGVRVTATVRDINHQRYTTTDPTTRIMTTRDDWYIEAEWTDTTTGETRRFRSDRLGQKDAERYPIGSPITVLIDPQNPDSYYVDPLFATPPDIS